ncbi:ornithine cyclodeaminase family protein [Pseudotenacibaculum sp. MALMAid0570]|uniref:ornithine cyclodeaminase family protein n=1 Tax=Pseudotenacibaculum sp. MALMAid0570 TaxID=3143938 RepID=UPI0032DE2D7A
MAKMVFIDDIFIEENTQFSELISEIKNSFFLQKTIVPTRHHHDFPNPKTQADTTLLLMPAWNSDTNSGIKVVTICPENQQFDLPSVQGTYIYLDATTGVLKAILEAKNLTAKRTAATSALASSFLSKENASSLLMIGTGALSKNLIKAHASVRPIKNVFVWGRNFEKAAQIASELQQENFTITAIDNILEKISEVDIISCATLSKTPLVLGKFLQPGQHIDLVGAYTPTMREADDQTIQISSVYVDTFEAGLKESGDIAIPLQSGILNEKDIKGDLFSLSKNNRLERKNDNEITVFKSVGHALEDLAAADYYYKKFRNE